MSGQQDGKGGRPRKYRTKEESKAAAAALRKASRLRNKLLREAASSNAIVDIQLDQLSLIQQAGPEGSGHITDLDYGIQTDGLDIPADEDQRVVEVTI